MRTRFFTGLFKGRQIKRISYRIVDQAYELSGQPPPDPALYGQDLLCVLQEVSLLLAGLQERKKNEAFVLPDLSHFNAEEQVREALDILQTFQIEEEHSLKESENVKAPGGERQTDKLSEEDVRPVVAALSGVGESQPGITATARYLMELVDWILLVRAGRASVQPEMLDEIYQRLVRTLATVEILLIDESGPCDFERQRVVGTRVTSDPMLEGSIYSTIRPGYLFHGQLLRPQEVIMYVHDDT